MARSRLVWAFGHHRLVMILPRCRLLLLTAFLADETHSHCRTDNVSLPTRVCGRVLWHLGDTGDASAAAVTQSSCGGGGGARSMCASPRRCRTDDMGAGERMEAYASLKTSHPPTTLRDP
jgi:hypothetical protein